jgi:hypothetical protein
LDSPVFLVQPSLFPYSRREKKWMIDIGFSSVYFYTL